MPKIRLIVEGDDGTQTEKTFGLRGDLDHLDGIDEAVEAFKNQALPQLEQELLARAQEHATQQEKKTAAGA
jgi:hypothetical protein